MDLLKGLIGLVVVFAIINGILWGGQELYYYKDTQEINKIESALDLEKIEIIKMKSDIESLSGSIDIKQTQLNDAKTRGLINQYNAGVDDINSLIDEYEKKVAIFNGKQNDYNRQVDQINVLIKKSGSRWYLIPIPLPGKSSRAKVEI